MTCSHRDQLRMERAQRKRKRRLQRSVTVVSLCVDGHEFPMAQASVATSEIERMAKLRPELGPKFGSRRVYTATVSMPVSDAEMSFFDAILATAREAP